MALLRSDRIISGLRRRFGVAAPKLSVRTHWSWKVKATLLGITAAIFAGLFYGGFDAGRLFAGFNLGKYEEERNRNSAELTALREESNKLRKDVIELTNNAQMAVGAKDVMTKQITTLQQENTQLKEQAAFFEKLMGSKAGSKAGLSVQRLQAERDSLTAYSFRALVVQGSADTPFKGRMTIAATIVTDNNKRSTINLPEEQPETTSSLALDFKTFQRVSGTIKVPPNAELKSLQVKIIQAGSKEPKATQALQL
jgi:hypothetical protein